MLCSRASLYRRAFSIAVTAWFAKISSAWTVSSVGAWPLRGSSTEQAAHQALAATQGDEEHVVGAATPLAVRRRGVAVTTS